MPAVRASQCLRYLRKRIILAIILSLSATYSLYRFSVKNHSDSTVQTQFDVVKSFRYNNKLFVWNTNTSEEDKVTSILGCRNSLQGKDFIVDNRGYICRPLDVLSDGCCDTNVTFTVRYVCDSCLENGCCTIYEHCLSCCMNPNKKPLLENILKKINSRLLFILSVTKNQFELCSVKCRTNSKSVHHGNAYRNPDHKFCYGDSPEEVSSD